MNDGENISVQFSWYIEIRSNIRSIFEETIEYLGLLNFETPDLYLKGGKHRHSLIKQFIKYNIGTFLK